MNTAVRSVEEDPVGIKGINAISEEVMKLKFHKKTYVIFDFEKTEPVISRLICSNGLDMSGNVRARPSQDMLRATFEECKGLIDPARPYFITYVFGYYNDSDRYCDVVMMISYIPETLNFRHKIVFASNTSYVLSKLDIGHHIQIHEMRDFNYEDIRAECIRIQGDK